MTRNSGGTASPLRRLVQLGLTEAVTRFGTLAATVLTARLLGPVSYGVFVYGYAAGSLSATATEAGLTGYLIREGAVGTAVLAAEVRTIARLRAAIAAIAVVVVAVGSVASGRPALHLATAVLLTLALSLRFVAQTPTSVLVGMGKPLAGLRQQTVERGVLLVALAAVLPWLRVPTAAGAAFLVASAAGAVVAFRLWAREGAHEMAPSGEEAPSAGAVILATWPFFVATMCIAAYMNAGSLVVSMRAGDAEAGVYGAALGLYMALVGAPQLVMRAVLRELAADPVGDAARRAIAQIAFSAVAAPGVVFVAADDIATALYGSAFAPAGPVLRVLAVGAACSFLAAYFVHVLYVHKRERLYAGVVAVSLLVFLAWLLVAPHVNALVTAGALAAAEAAGLIGLVVGALRTGLFNLRAGLRDAAAGGAAAGVLPVLAGVAARGAALYWHLPPTAVLVLCVLAAAVPGLYFGWRLFVVGGSHRTGAAVTP